VLSQGRPVVNSWITVATLVVTLVGDFALIPVFDITGAAVASSLAYVTHLVLSLIAYQQLSGTSALDALVPKVDDVQMLTNALRAQVPRPQRS
jgi:Na+-driven multidrug efflux pump